MKKKAILRRFPVFNRAVKAHLRARGLRDFELRCDRAFRIKHPAVGFINADFFVEQKQIDKAPDDFSGNIDASFLK